MSSRSLTSTDWSAQTVRSYPGGNFASTMYFFTAATIASRSSPELRSIDTTIPARPLIRLVAATSANSSRTVPRSPTVSTRPSGSVTSGSFAISAPTYRLFFPRSRISPPSLRIVPPGSSRFSRRTMSATFCNESPYLRRFASEISMSIW